MSNQRPVFSPGRGRPLCPRLCGDGLDGQSGGQTLLWSGLRLLRSGLGSVAARTESVAGGLGSIHNGLEGGGSWPHLLPARLSEGDLILDGLTELGLGPGHAVGGVPHPVHAGPGPLDGLGLDWAGHIVSVVIPALRHLQINKQSEASIPVK